MKKEYIRPESIVYELPTINILYTSPGEGSLGPGGGYENPSSGGDTGGNDGSEYGYD